jgi:hypothetical protein
MLEQHPLILESQSKLCSTAAEAVKRTLEGVLPDDIQFVWDLCLCFLRFVRLAYLTLL